MFRSLITSTSRQSTKFLFKPSQFSRTMSIKVGDKIPEGIPLFEKNPGDKVNLSKELAGKKCLILGVPGAFSSACSETMIPGYLKKSTDLISKGFDSMIVVSVNDAFVMNAWRESFHIKPDSSQVSFFADPDAKFTKALGLEFDATAFFGNERSKRYCLAVDDGVVIGEFVEPDNVSVNVSAAEKVFKELPGLE